MTDVVTVILTFDQILASDAEVITPEGTIVKTYRLGDAKPDGTLNIADALFIAQYLAGLREIGEGADFVHAINAASIKQDGLFDKINIADVLFIAQRLVGLRDVCFIQQDFGAPPPR